MGRGPGVRAVGAEAIQIDFRWKGQRFRERLRLKPSAANLKYATRLKASIEHAIATNNFTYADFFPRSVRAHTASASLRLREALRAYVRSLHGQVEPETIAKYGYSAETVADGLGDPPLGELTRAKARHWVSTLNLSKKRIDNLLIPLRGTLEQAVEDGILPANPLAGFKVRRIAKPQDTIDPFTRAEVAALSKTALGHVWAFWAWTGLRSGELIGLRWGDVDSQLSQVAIRRSVRVGREKGTKTRSGGRVVRLLPPARRALATLDRRGAGEPVFTRPSDGCSWYEDRALARAFRKACEAAKVRYRYPYQLRHTWASWALSSGENPAWIARQLGHRDMTMLFRVYGKYMPEMNPNAGRKMLAGKAA